METDWAVIVGGGFAVLGVVFLFMVKRGYFTLPQFQPRVVVEESPELSEDEEISQMVTDCLPASTPSWPYSKKEPVVI